MALAKFYEDILERLLVESDSLSQSFLANRPSEKNNQDEFIAYVKAHMKASKKLLNEILEILTAPEIDETFKKIDSINLSKQRDSLEVTKELLISQSVSREELVSSLNSECHTLQRKVDKLEQDNKRLKKLTKKK